MWQCPKCKKEFQKQNQNHFCKEISVSIIEYINSQPKVIQPILFQIRNKIIEVLPNVKEKISWQMPTFYREKNIIHFAAFKKHVGIYPGPDAIVFFHEKLKDYHFTKGAIQFPYEKEIPYSLIQEIAFWCDHERIVKDGKTKKDA